MNNNNSFNYRNLLSFIWKMIIQMDLFIIENICSYPFVFPELLFCPECQYYLIASLIDHRSIKSIVYDIQYDFISCSQLPKGRDTKRSQLQLRYERI